MNELLMTGGGLSSMFSTANVFEKDEYVDAHIHLSNPETKEYIFNQWPRASSRTFISDPSTATGYAAAWQYDNTVGTFYHPDNTPSNEMILSPYFLSGDYEYSVEITSTGTDDDAIGQIIAFQETATSLRFLSVWVQTGGFGPSSVTVRYGDESNTGIGDIIAQKDILEKRVSSSGGWGGTTTDPRQFRIRIKTLVQGDSVTVMFTDWDDTTTYLPDSEINVSFSTLPRDGYLLRNNSRFGFGTISQPNSYFIDYSLVSMDVVDQYTLYSSESNNKWTYEESTDSWNNQGNVLGTDFETSQIIKSIITNRDYMINNTSEFVLIRDKGISDPSVVIDVPANTNHTIDINTLLSNYTFDGTLTITDAFLPENITSLVLNSTTISFTSGTVNGSFFIKITSGDMIFEYRKIEINIV